MGASLDELVALMKQRGTADGFPERDELHGLLEPFRALPDQESVRLALAATLRKGDRLVARVAAESLAYLAKQAAGPLLVGIFVDETLTVSQRAAAVWAMDRHLPGYREQLDAAEQSVYMNLPVLEMLEDPEADQGFGLNALLSGYTAMAPSARTALVSAIAEAACERGIRIAGLCMHLLGAETDGESRRRLLDFAAADASQEAVDLLATFAAAAEDAAEAKHARRHLHLLRAKGLRGVVRQDLGESRALITGVDGDACFSVNVIIPRVPTFDLANLLFHLESGARDGFVMRNLPGRSVDEVVGKIRDGCGTISAFVPMPLAARIIDECLRVSKPASLATPDVAKAMALVEPALVEARQHAFIEPAAPADATVSAEEVKRLLDGAGFESWFFETAEDTVQNALAALGKPIRSKGKAGAKILAGRLGKATDDLCGRLRADGEHLRLQRMLRHQARLLGCGGDAERASLCRKLAVEVVEPASMFLAHMAVQAIIAALEPQQDDSRAGRFLEARQHLRSRQGHEERGHRKSDVAHLDMAAAAHTEMTICNREAPSAQRVSLAAIEDAAFALGGLLVEELAQQREADALLPRVVRVLEERDLFAAKDRERVAEEIVSGGLALYRSVCSERCPHHCFDELRGDGRAAFYADGLPWRAPDETPPPSRRNRA